VFTQWFAEILCSLRLGSDRRVSATVCVDIYVTRSEPSLGGDFYINALTCQSEEFIKAWYSAGVTDLFE
jgi:hypothetical protein